MLDRERNNKELYTIIMFIIFALFAIFMFVLSISIGSVSIPFFDVFKNIASGHIKGITTSTIIWNIRIPRSIAAAFGGAAIAVAGLLLQIFFRNPIVEPFILGISSGSSLMVGLVMLGGVVLPIPTGVWTIFIAAFVGAMLVMMLVLMVATRVKSIITLLIIGLMIGYLCSSFTSILISFANANNVKGFAMWQMGSFSGFTWQTVGVLVSVVTPLLFISLFIGKPLNALMLGENYAQSLGVNIKTVRIFIVLVSSLLCGVVTAFAGPVSFVGLAVPHLARITLKTSNNKILFPAAMLIGAGLTVACDLLARMLFSPTEIPLSAVTALIGAPLVIYMMMRRPKDA